MKYITDLDWNYLRFILFYCPWTGLWTWKVDKGKRGKGKIAGTKDKDGYITISIGDKNFRTHRIAWYYMFGEWPEKQIDHKNRIRDDNRFINLRLATEDQNQSNSGKHKNNTSGYKGVFWKKRNKKWYAQIRKDKKDYHLGYFIDPIEAAKTYDKKAFDLFGEFAYLNF